MWETRKSRCKTFKGVKKRDSKLVNENNIILQS